MVFEIFQEVFGFFWRFLFGEVVGHGCYYPLFSLLDGHFLNHFVAPFSDYVDWEFFDECSEFFHLHVEFVLQQIG
jgi:hypothetical protein